MSDIDLSLLKAPQIVEEFTHEQLLEFRIQFLRANGIDVDNFSPSDPLYRNLLSNAYRELLMRSNANQQAVGLLLAFAVGPALDHIGATYHRVTRLAGESDDDYRRRIQLSPEGSSVAGPVGKYIFEALSADVLVKDASFDSPAPVEVLMTILSKDGNGTPSQSLINIVNTHLMDDGVRPQTDLVTVVGAEVVEYQLTATLKISSGPDAQSVHDQALTKIQQYTDKQHKLSGTVSLFGVHGALSVAGVNDVDLTDFNEINCTKQQAPYCTSIILTTELSS